MDIEITAKLIGLGGVLITAILSSAGYFYRSQIEGKKSARTVLYLLLEIRYVIITSLFDPDTATEKYIDHYVQRLNAQGVPASKEDVENKLLEMVTSHFRSVISSLKIDIQSRLLVPYEGALINFAAINPVLAYQLRGREKLEALISHSKTYLNSVSTEIIPSVQEEWLKNLLLEVSNETKEDVLQDLSESLDADILLLARHCGRSDYQKCKKVFDQGMNVGNKYDFSELDDLFDKLMVRVIEAANDQIQTTANASSD